MLDVVKLVEQSHGNSARKGWWQDEQDGTTRPGGLPGLDPRQVETQVETKLVLTSGELVGEAFEEVRRLEPEQLKLIYVECSGGPMQHATHREVYPSKCKGKPVGFLIELADAAIRICDLAGAMRVGEAVAAQYGAVHEAYAESYIPTHKSTIAHQLRVIERELSHAWPVYEGEGKRGGEHNLDVLHEDFAIGLGTALAEVELLAVIAGASLQDFEQAIAIKAVYNATRPHRHGGLRA